MKMIKMCLNLVMAYPQVPSPFVTHIPYFGNHFTSKQKMTYGFVLLTAHNTTNIVLKDPSML